MSGDERKSLRYQNRRYSQTRAARGADSLPHRAVYRGRGFRLFRAVEEEPSAGCRSIFQFATGRDFDGTGGGVGTGGVAVGARGPKDKRDPVNAPDLRMHIERVDLAGVLDPLACAPASGEIITKVPVADRSARGLDRGAHGSSWRISQWGKRNPIDAVDQSQRASRIADVGHLASGGYLAIVDSPLEASDSPASGNRSGPEITQATAAIAAIGSALK